MSFQGYFDDNFSKNDDGIIASVNTSIIKHLNKSLLYKKVLKYIQTTSDHIELFLGIVDTAEDIFCTRYPQATFHVLFWDEKGDKTSKKLLSGLRSREIQAHLISDLLPGYATNEQKYMLNRYDRHPNLLANDIIAEYIVNDILGK